MKVNNIYGIEIKPEYYDDFVYQREKEIIDLTELYNVIRSKKLHFHNVSYLEYVSVFDEHHLIIQTSFVTSIMYIPKTFNQTDYSLKTNGTKHIIWIHANDCKNNSVNPNTIFNFVDENYKIINDNTRDYSSLKQELDTYKRLRKLEQCEI